MTTPTPTPVDSQVLEALKTLIVAAATAAGSRVFVDRTAADPFAAAELPAINLVSVEESVSTPSTVGAAYQGMQQNHTFQVVLQVLVSNTLDAGAIARLISAQAAQAIGTDPTLGGLCSNALQPTGKQWVFDDESETRFARQNNLWLCRYRTHSHDPFTAI